MKPEDSLNAPEALVLTMVLVAAADGGITDREIGIMSGQVQTLPAFHDLTSEQMAAVTDAAVALLKEDDGLAHAGRLIRAALPGKLRETAYALACEVVAGDSGARRETSAGDAGARRETSAGDAGARRETSAGDAGARRETSAGDASGRDTSLDILEFVRGELDLDPLISAAIERGVRARHHRVVPGA